MPVMVLTMGELGAAALIAWLLMGRFVALGLITLPALFLTAVGLPLGWAAPIGIVYAVGCAGAVLTAVWATHRRRVTDEAFNWTQGDVIRLDHVDELVPRRSDVQSRPGDGHVGQ